jgi:hypothetical protein
MVWYGMDWSGSGQGKVVGSYEISNGPSGSIKCCKTVGLSGSAQIHRIS